MKTKLNARKIFLSILVLFILSCAPVTELIGTPDNSGDSSDRQTTEPQSATLPPTNVPTVRTTATVYPPVFTPDTLGDIRELASFIVTETNKRTEDGKVEVDLRGIFEYIKEPFSMHWELGDMYVIGDASYERINARKGWRYQAGTYPGDVQDVLEWQLVLIPAALVSNLQSAQFLGQEDFNGIPANHFTFDQSNFPIYSTPVPGEQGYILEEAQGDFYLAQDGNYLLYWHAVESAIVIEPNGTQYSSVQENTYELSMMNQLAEIALPADFDLELDLGLPLPAGTTLGEIKSYRDGFSPDRYYYTMPVSYDEFLEFYKNLVPTNGFTFSRIGEVPNNFECGSQDCVILNKGSAEIILSYGSGTNSNFLTVQVDR